MKVRIPAFTVDIDPEAWDMNFCTGTKAADIRADVIRYVQNGATEQLLQIGVANS